MKVLTQDSQSQEAISHYIRKKARKLARHPAFKPADIPDIEQALHIKLFRANKSYDARRATPLAFARMVIARHARSLLSSQTAIRRNPKGVATLNKSIRLPSGEFAEIGLTILEEEGRRHRSVCRRTDEQQSEIRHDVISLLGCLPPKLKQLALDLQTLTKSEIANRYGISRADVARQTAEIRRYGESLGLDTFL